MNKTNSPSDGIPERFRREIILHIVKNFSPTNNSYVPLLCGIHGPSGEGKTFQCERVLQELGTRIFLISGGQLESDNAGEPARLIRTTYLNASKIIEQKESATAAIVINDIDTGLGDWGEMVQTTVNRQSVFGELMHLVDYPTSVEGRKTKRIPIIITGNDFTKLYEPLVRPGRMNSFIWRPTIEEKATIIASIFGYLTIHECIRLIEELDEEMNLVSKNRTPSLPVAAYTHLKATLLDEQLWVQISAVGIEGTVELIRKGLVVKIDDKFSLNEIVSAGKNLIKSGQLVNHLWRNK
jgi:hypothetical protein